MDYRRSVRLNPTNPANAMNPMPPRNPEPRANPTTRRSADHRSRTTRTNATIRPVSSGGFGRCSAGSFNPSFSPSTRGRHRRVVPTALGGCVAPVDVSRSETHEGSKPSASATSGLRIGEFSTDRREQHGATRVTGEHVGFDFLTRIVSANGHRCGFDREFQGTAAVWTGYRRRLHDAEDRISIADDCARYDCVR